MTAPVCLTFDDCALADGLEWTLDLLKELGIRGTFFIATGHVTVPGMRVEPDQDRLLTLWRRIAGDGHEVACHTRRHLDGTKFTMEEWIAEIEDGLLDLDELEIADGAEGFRAPKLGVNADMFDALSDLGFTYDSSLILKPATRAVELPGSIRELPMRLLRTSGKGDPAVPPLDFNMWVGCGMRGGDFFRTIIAAGVEHAERAGTEPLVLGFHPDEYDARYEKADQAKAPLDERRHALATALTALRDDGARFATCAEAVEEMGEKI